MTKKHTRFARTYTQGTTNVSQIWVDLETGINYHFHMSGYAGGMTPLLDRSGKPIISSASEIDRLKYSDK